MKNPLLKLVLALCISTMLASFSSNTENKGEASSLAPFKVMLIKHSAGVEGVPTIEFYKQAK